MATRSFRRWRFWRLPLGSKNTSDKALILKFALLAGGPAYAQHGVIREYASLAPKADAVPLRPVLDVPLTDVSVTLGHDRAYSMTGSAVSADGAAYSRTVTIWRSPDLAKWSVSRVIPGALSASFSAGHVRL